MNLLRFIVYLLQSETDPNFKSEATLGARSVAIEYRDYYWTEEFQNLLKTFDEGGEIEDKKYEEWSEGSDYFMATDDMCEFSGEIFLLPSGISFQDCLDKVHSGERSESFPLKSDFFSEIRDTILDKNIIPDALELARSMNNKKKVA